MGLPLIFSKYFPGFKNMHFGSIFSSLRLKNVLNSIKPLKRYCKATLKIKNKIFFIKKYIYSSFTVSSQWFYTV